EHHAQRELAQSGWSIRYEPSARAERRIVPARGLIARRARYGARLGAIGHARTPAAAARQAASSLAGAAAALARADRAQATERLARAAENAGVLAGERLAHKQLAPAGHSPFRAQIPSGRPARERRR